MFHIYDNKSGKNESYYMINISPELSINDLIREISRKFKIKEKIKLYKKRNDKLEELFGTQILSNYLYEIIYMN